MSQHDQQTDSHPKWHSMGLSLLTHVMLLSLLVVSCRWTETTGRGEPDRPVGVVLSMSNPEKTEYLTEEDVEKESRKPKDSSAATPASPDSFERPSLEMSNSTDLPGPALVPDLDVNQMTKVPVSTGTSHEFELSAADLKLIAEDQRRLKALQPKGDPASISVFGTGQLEGRSFVFVIDRSTSMGSSGLGVIERACGELTEAINQLKPNHTFQIVAYHNRTVTIARRKLLAATPSNKKLVPEFLQNLVAFGATSHENGLTAALTFRPDVIVLLTDGGPPSLNGSQLDVVKLMARGHTQIHCLQFGTGQLQETENFLTRLARANNGTFRYVDVTKW